MRHECPECGAMIHLNDHTSKVWEYRCPECHEKVIDPAEPA